MENNKAIKVLRNAINDLMSFKSVAKEQEDRRKNYIKSLKKALLALENNDCANFGYWLVNAPNKEIYSKKWIELKYKQYLKEKKEVLQNGKQ